MRSGVAAVTLFLQFAALIVGTFKFGILGGLFTIIVIFITVLQASAVYESCQEDQEDETENDKE